MTTPQERYGATYRFGALERRGLAGGLRGGQILVLAAACLFAVAVFRRMPTPGGLALAAFAIVAACLSTWLPVAGRTLDEWTPVMLGWLALRASGRAQYRSAAPTRGRTFDLRGHPKRPARALAPPAEHVQLLGVPMQDGRRLGILADRRTGTYTAVAVVNVRSFGLLAAADQERRLERWGRALASLARDDGCVRRVQVMERTLPHDEDQLARWLQQAGDPAIEATAPMRRSYEGLVASAADVTQDHEVLVAVQVDPRRGRLTTPAGGRRHTRDEASSQLLLRELRSLADRLEAAEAGIAGLLSVEQCAATIRLAYEPHLRADYSRLSVVDPEHLGPSATEVMWDRFRCDGALHRTFWVAHWPRLEVGPAFLAPLLLCPTVVRSFSVVLEPVPPARARSAVEAAVTSDEADEQLRQERGFRTTARRRRQQDATRRREAELADGHEELRFAAFLTVSARDEEELERGSQEVVQAAHQAYLDLQPLWGQQNVGFVFGALPLCDGLGPGGLLDR